MYYIQKTLTISAAHNLTLSYESKCEQLHGHNWVITVYCKAKELNKDGMVTDFTHIKRVATCWMSILRQRTLPAGYVTMWRTATR